MTGTTIMISSCEEANTCFAASVATGDTDEARKVAKAAWDLCSGQAGFSDCVARMFSDLYASVLPERIVFGLGFELINLCLDSPDGDRVLQQVG